METLDRRKRASAAPRVGTRIRIKTAQVVMFHHDTEATGSFDWTADELLAAIRAHRPSRASDPDRTFCVGTQPEYLSVSTTGPRRFAGQHPVWGEAGNFEGAMIFTDLTFRDVRGILEWFYAGRRAEGCFAPYHGRFEFYRPEQEDAPSAAAADPPAPHGRRQARPSARR
jgi:hypothetical protein